MASHKARYPTRVPTVLVDASIFADHTATTTSNNRHEPSILELDANPMQPSYRKHPRSLSSFHAVDRFQPHKSHHRVLGTLGIVVITYFIGCGGPLGSEPVIASTGPLIGLPAFIVYPLLVVVPYGYILAELCTAFPEDGGFVVWVLNAFGPFWGFQVGYWSWLSGAFNCALLPGLLFKLLDDSFQIRIASPVHSYFAKAAIGLLASIPSFLGTRNVERSCLVLIVLVLVPMVVFTVWGWAVGVDYADLLEVRHGGRPYFDNVLEDEILTGPIKIDWPTLLNTLFWNFDGIAMASVFGGEVSNPARVYPRAIAITIAVTMATYLIPMPAAIITETPHWSIYQPDSYPLIAKTIGGSVLEAFVLTSSICGILGMFLSGLYCKSFQLCGMSENHLVSASLGQRNTRFDSPHVSLAVTLSFTLMVLSIDFKYLLPVANVFLCGVQLLIIAAAIRLRVVLPYIPQPTKVPGGIWMMALFALLPLAMLSYIVFDTLHMLQAAVILASLVTPGLLYGGYQHYRARAEEEAPSPDMFEY